MKMALGSVVELDMFSGQPNPRWQLNAARAGRLKSLHARLQPGGAGPEPPGLGYRGFTYGLDGTTWRAFRGRVEGGGRAWTDPGCEIERYLVASLPKEQRFLADRILAELP